MTYKKLKDNEGFEMPLPSLIKFACCDCGLIHWISFAIEENGNLGMVLKRDKRATAQSRRWKKKQSK